MTTCRIAAWLLLTIVSCPFSAQSATRTPLMEAAHKGDVAAMDALLAAGADVNQRDEDRATPLMVTAERGHLTAAAALLKAGADVNAKDKKGRTPLHHAAGRTSRPVIELLLKAGAQVDARDDSLGTPLHAAVHLAQRDAVEALLAAGASLDAKDRDGRTAMGYLDRTLYPQRRGEISALLQQHMFARQGDPKALLARLTADLKARSDSDQVRKALLATARKVNPPPAVPEDAINFEGRAQYAFKNARNDADYVAAAREYMKAIAAAPWVAGYYYDLCVILEKAQRLKEAKRACEIYVAAETNPADGAEARRKLAGLGYALEQLAARKPAECITFEHLYAQGAKVAVLGGKRISLKLISYPRGGQLANALLVADITDPNGPTVTRIFPFDPIDNLIQVDDRDPGYPRQQLTIDREGRVSMRSHGAAQPEVVTSVAELQKLRAEQMSNCTLALREGKLYILLGQGGAPQRANGDFVAGTLLFAADCKGKLLSDRPGWMPDFFFKRHGQSALEGVLHPPADPCSVGRHDDLGWLSAP